MTKIKLTPFYLFILLLIVLVISIVFGYSKRTKLHEGLGSMVMSKNANSQNSANSGGSMTGNATPNNAVATTTFLDYGPATLNVLQSATSTTASGTYNILFDNTNGNVIVYSSSYSSSASTPMSSPGSSPSASNPNNTFDVIQRNGNESTYTKSTISKLPVSPSISSSSNDAPNYAWTYGNGAICVLYVSWNTNTIIYLVDPMQNIILTTFIAGSNGVQSHVNNDTSINNTPLSPMSLTNPLNYAVQQSSGPIPLKTANLSAYQITQNVYFNTVKGLITQNSMGSYDTSTNINGLNSTVKQDSINNATAVATSFFSNSTINTAIAVITYDSSNTMTPYSIFTTARISNTGPANNKGQGGQGRMGGQGQYNPRGDMNLEPHQFDPNNSYDPMNPGSNVIWKTEIVPPVCPMYPIYGQGQGQGQGQSSPSSGQCNLTADASGDIVDCNGNIIIPAPTPSPAPTTSAAPTPSSSTPSSTPSGWSNFGTGVSNTITGTADTVGNVANTAIGTAGNLATGLGTGVSNLATGLGTGVSNLATGVVGDATGLVGGLGKDVTGLVGGLGKDVAGLGNNAIDSATGLLSGAGSEAAYLANNAAYAQGQGYPYGYGYGQGYPYGYGYNQAYGQGYPGVNYPGGSGGQGQGCGCNAPPQYPSTNYLPITSDFSQFAK